MSKKQTITIIAVGLGVVVLALVLYFINQFQGQKLGVDSSAIGEDTNVVTTDESGNIQETENPRALPTVEGGTRKVIQEKIETPDKGSEVEVPENVAIPVSVSKAGLAEKRVFDIEIDNGELNYNTIVVNELDIIEVNFKAVDKDYRIYFPDFGISVNVLQGQTEKVQFQATAYGQYKFQCVGCKNEWSGKLIVNQRQ